MTLSMIGLAFYTLIALTSAQTGEPTVQASQARLRVGGEVERQLNLSDEELAKLPRRKLRAKDHGGTESEYEGVPLIEILKLAGIASGEKLRGDKMTLYLLVEASDAYRAVVALPELDPAFTDKLVLLVDRRDGKPLSGQEGPLRIIVPDEKRHARWVRQVISLVVKRSS
jgi:DMSO/TMAO reductase YedYZ molybdopterin-dependent catalytic subunit